MLLRRLVLPAALIAVSLSATACGDGDEAPASKAPGATTSEPGKPGKGTTPAKVKPGNVSPENLPESPKVANAKGARADVSLKGCPVRDGKATASGKVKNSTGATTDYAITISWVNQRSDVLARGVAVVRDLTSGQSVAWKVSAPARAGIATCTVFVERGEVR